MTVSLFWQIQTSDYDSWLNPDQEGLAQMMKSQGVLAYSLHRSADDPNSVMVHYQFEDRSAVDSFEDWYGPIREEYQKQHAGSSDKIDKSWVGDDVPGYARRFS